MQTARGSVGTNAPRRCRRDQSPHRDCVSANNDPLPPSFDDHIERPRGGFKNKNDLWAMQAFLMANTDLSTQFEKISDQEKTATQHLLAASQHTTDQLAVDAAGARDRATAAANQLQDNTDGARNKVSSR
jgi:hypothetical protein